MVTCVEKVHILINKALFHGKEEISFMFRKSLEELLSDRDEKLVVDLRRKEDFMKESYPGAINIYHGDFYKYLDILPKNKRIYVFCYTGVSGDEIAEDLSKKGFDIYSIEEGYRAILRMNVRRMMRRK